MPPNSRLTCKDCAHWNPEDRKRDGARALIGTCRKVGDYGVLSRELRRASGWNDDGYFVLLKARVTTERALVQSDSENPAVLRTSAAWFCPLAEAKVAPELVQAGLPVKAAVP